MIDHVATLATWVVWGVTTLGAASLTLFSLKIIED